MLPHTLFFPHGTRWLGNSCTSQTKRIAERGAKLTAAYLVHVPRETARGAKLRRQEA